MRLKPTLTTGIETTNPPRLRIDVPCLTAGTFEDGVAPHHPQFGPNRQGPRAGKSRDGSDQQDPEQQNDKDSP